MTARFRKMLDDLAETFWLVPALIVLLGIGIAFLAIEIDRGTIVADWLRDEWLYNGGATGARTLLGAIASSTIGVAGTVFSIMIAALSLAAGQMGPRLLRNFTRDRGNQITLGVFLATFCYALIVLRSVRTPAEGAFVPHLATTIGIVLAFLSVATLVYFVGHMSGRINVDTVIGLVSDDVQSMIHSLTREDSQPAPPPARFWQNAVPIIDPRQGYLVQLDERGLATWACEHDTAIHLLVRPGDYIFPGAPIAMATMPRDGIEEAIRNATALGPQQVTSADLRFAVRQLVEVAVRALSPGINDPHTAITVLDRLGAALCEMQPLRLQTSVWIKEGKPALVVPHLRYHELVAAMFDMIRQNAADAPPVLIRMIEVMIQVVSCERDPQRIDCVREHADLVLADAERCIRNPSDLDAVRNHHRRFTAVFEKGPIGRFLT
ncbi:DUF2254 domain-containing protein [Bradyrhizobium sp. 83012]|uniref:DUF2254 domain-containing protein n=1 Tax=Bradyrhizobium aeschynomenes TaxID=2734909 RepID=A0ABX2C7B2_9BRAD|nr:DUF2254 domain-containing protein [Bradyrhizobium aeschynomenes]NPU63643.1 DUF2254 domain-containing protein [Bradyrhizobium aeschynomenes]